MEFIEGCSVLWARIAVGALTQVSRPPDDEYKHGLTIPNSHIHAP